MKAEVQATLVDGRQRFVVTWFRRSSPGAKLALAFDDYLENGHLIIEAKLTVAKPARYHLQGGLVSTNGTFISWAQRAKVISTPGTHVMKLRFFGLTFRDAGIPGPYILKYITLAETGVRPVKQGNVYFDAYKTKAYTLDQFSTQLDPDPALDRTIRQAKGLVPN